MSRKKTVSDDELLAELTDGTMPVVTQIVSSGRFEACMECEFRDALVCKKIQPKGDSYLNLASAVRRADVSCPVGKWPA